MMTVHKLTIDPVTRLILQALSELIEKERIMSAEVDRLAPVVNDLAAAVTGILDRLDALAAKLGAIVPADPNDAPNAASAADRIVALTQAINDKLANVQV